MSAAKISTIILLCFAYVAADFTFDYKFRFPSDPYIKFRLGNDSREVRALLDTNRAFSMVFNASCNYKDTPCSNNTHLFGYRAYKSGGQKLNSYFRDRFTRFTGFQGTLYKDTLKFGGYEFPIELGAITEGSTSFKFDWDGVLGLGIGDGETSVVKKILKELTVKQITIQEGNYYMSRPGRGYDFDSSGSITFGEFNSSMCGNFTFVKAHSTGGWRFTTDIVLGNNETLTDQVVAFTPARFSEAPESIIKKYYNDISAKNEDTFHDISFSIGDKTYKTTKHDFSWYYDPAKTYSARIHTTYPQYGYDFAFGSDFLQHYCVALLADDKLENFQIGFAENNDATKVVGSVVLLLIGALLSFRL